jgi:hypothetical protein
MSTNSPKDPSDEQNGELLSLLYGELDEDQARGTEEKLRADAELSEELDQLQGLRGLFAALPDEEPPAAISNKLLAIAAQEAPKSAGESRGLWATISGWFAPIARHPALAAAASFALVAGVAGTLYVTGNAQMATPGASDSPAPTAAREQAAPAAGAQPAAPTGKLEESPNRDKLTGLEGGEIGEFPGEEIATEEDADEAEAAADDMGDKSDQYRQAASERERKPIAKRKSKARAVARTVDGIASSDIPIPNAPPAQASTPMAPGADVAGDAPKSGMGTGAAPADQAPEEPQAVTEKRTEQTPQRPYDSNRELHDRALRYAKKGECGKVAEVASQLLKQDPKYYKANIPKDRRLGRCLDAARNRAAKKKKAPSKSAPQKKAF